MKKIITAGILLSAALSANAAISITYDFATNLTATTTGGSAAENATGTDLANGAFTGGNIGTGRSSQQNYFVRGEATGNLSTDGDELSEAVANGAFVTFTIENTGTSDLQLTSLSWRNFDGNNSISSMFAFQGSQGFTDGDEIGSTTLGTATSIPDGSSVNGAVTLSNVLAVGATEEFRFYFIDGSDEVGEVQRFDDIIVTAEAVPEPSSTALLGLGGLALILRRRK